MWIEQASTIAPQFDWIMILINVITIVSFIVVNGVMVYLIIRYRRRSDDDETSSIAHNTTIEVVWTLVPTIVMMILFVMGINLFNNMRAQPADSMDITVWGAKWNWEFTYPSDITGSKTVKSSTLYLQEKQHAKLIMKSRDVIHSFFVPAFRVKEDVVGSMYTYVSFNPLITKEQIARPAAKRVAEDPCRKLYDENQKLSADKKLSLNKCAAYRVYCTEYCGKDHSAMLNWAVVLEKADFKKKLSNMSGAANEISADVGADVFKNKCVACHTNSGARLVGPTFKGLYGKKREFTAGPAATADDNYLRESILEPNKKVVKGFPPAMPPQSLSEAEIKSVIKYIQSLK